MSPMLAYYNENDLKIAPWLDALISAEHITRGTIDTRSIHDVRADDLTGYLRCHFFAGIAGWEEALRLAGWPADRPVWTGSCPCQPFSAAGKGKGEADERHLWPEFRRLIAECRPPIVFGEQVASRAGREWLNRVRLDLEALGYAVGAADLCAAGVGAPHIRQRLYWVAKRVSDAERWPAERQRLEMARAPQGVQGQARQQRLRPDIGYGVVAGGYRMGHAHVEGSARNPLGLLGPTDLEPWSDYTLLDFTDGKKRRAKPGLQLLASGVPGRVAQLRGLGNAIVPQVAAQFIAAFLEAEAN